MLDLLTLYNLFFVSHCLAYRDMSTGSEDGDRQETGAGFVKSLVKALSGNRWTPGRKDQNSGSKSPTESEVEHATVLEQAQSLLPQVEHRHDSAEMEDDVLLASRNDIFSRQEGFSSDFNDDGNELPGSSRKDRNLLASDQNLLSDLQRISDFAYSSVFPPDMLGERVGRNDAITGFDFGENRGDPISRFHPVSPYPRQPMVTGMPALPGTRDGVRFSPYPPQDQAGGYGGSAYGGTEFSTRLGRRDSANVTGRDAKRPKERTRDKEYKKRFSMGSSKGEEHEFSSSPGRPREEERLQRATVGVDPMFLRNQSSRLEPRLEQSRGDPRAIATGVDTPYQIRLVFEGRSVDHRVWATMSIVRLIEDASVIFGLDPDCIFLVLLSVLPTNLRREDTVAGPPRLSQNAVVMVFHVVPSSHFHRIGNNDGFRAPGVGQGFQQAQSVPVPILNSKLLASFKLPKFDGNARSWKAWDKAFQRFLGLHQLDQVLEEDFLLTVWAVQGARESNKIVFFLIEDAVAPNTLAAKLVRQATKWNGHEAYVLLRNGYVFSGPQTATILLADLSRLRLNRDEDASAFCLRLVELIEDLELIPGPAAVFLTDTQKLGYLLSAIRHETSLQGVYVQLQSEQLRGTVSFDQACQELHHRCEAIKADEFLDSRPGKALVSTEQKKKGAHAVPVEKLPCLTKGCVEMIQHYLPLCKLCYLQCMAGKSPSLTLRDNLGVAVYNATTKKVDFPPAVPTSRFPKKGLKKGRKALMAGVPRRDEVSSSSEVSEE